MGVLVHWEAEQELLDRPQPPRQTQLHTPVMHNTDCIVPSDLLAIL